MTTEVMKTINIYTVYNTKEANFTSKEFLRMEIQISIPN